MLNLIGPIGNQLGYGIVTLNIVNTLHKMGIQFSLSPIGDSRVPIQYQPSVNQGLTTKYNEKWPTVKIYHQHDLSMPPTIKKIGFPIFELTDFTSQEIEAINSTDKVFVCSDWASEVVNRTFYPKKVATIPLGIDSDIFKINESKVSNLKDRPIKFINVGKWEKRKGHDILPDILLGLEDQDFELWMLPNNPFISTLADRNWKHSYRDKLGERVKFLPRMDNQSEVAGIMQECDIGVFPARAEGWNLDLVEVMACTGLPAYFTNYSGHTEISKLLSDFIPYDNQTSHYSLELAEDGIWFNRQGSWAHVVVRKEITRLERVIYEAKCYTPKTRVDFSRIVNNVFSWEKTVKKVLSAI